MKNQLAKQYTLGSLLKFSFPTIIGMVFMSMYSMVDGIFVSRLIGTDALAAINIVYPLISIVVAVGIMLSTGGSAIAARKMGEGKPDEARQDFSLVMLVGIALGTVLTIVGFLFLEPLLYLLGADDAIYALCWEYAYPMVGFIALSMLQLLFQMFFVTAGRPGIGLLLTVLGGVANIVLDYVFIAVLHWGIAGAAIATGIGYSIPGVFGLLWFLLNRKGTLYLVKPVWRGKVLLQTVTNGSSEMVTNLSTAVITYLFNIIMMEYLGADGVAAITIVLYSEMLLIAVYLGYSSGIAPIISYNHGEENIPQLKWTFRVSIIFLLACSLATFAGAMLFARRLVAIFAPEGTAVFMLAVHGFYLYAIGYLFKGVNIFASSMFTALSDGKTSALLSFLRTLVFIVAGMLLLPLAMHVNGVWLAVPFAEVLSIIVSVCCFRKQLRGSWSEARAASAQKPTHIPSRACK